MTWNARWNRALAEDATRYGNWRRYFGNAQLFDQYVTFPARQSNVARVYKLRALRMHPDKHARSSNKATEVFKQLSRYYDAASRYYNHTNVAYAPPARQNRPQKRPPQNRPPQSQAQKRPPQNRPPQNQAQKRPRQNQNRAPPPRQNQNRRQNRPQNRPPPPRQNPSNSPWNSFGRLALEGYIEFYPTRAVPTRAPRFEVLPVKLLNSIFEKYILTPLASAYRYTPSTYLDRVLAGYPRLLQRIKQPGELQHMRPSLWHNKERASRPWFPAAEWLIRLALADIVAKHPGRTIQLADVLAMKDERGTDNVWQFLRNGVLYSAYSPPTPF